MNLTRYHLWIGFIQGALLLLLHQAITHDWYLMSWPEFIFPAYAIVVTLPIFILMCHRLTSHPSLYKMLAVIFLLFALLGSYSGHLAFDNIGQENIAHSLVFASNILLFMYISLAFIQSYLKRGNIHFNYSDLYEFGWLNTCVFLIAGFFTVLTWGLLTLCAALFSILNISLFADIFSDPYFIYPATAMMFSYGISLGITRFHIAMVQRIDFFFRAVTVLTSLIVILFLIGLLVSGLKPLWETGSATFLVLWLQVCILLFINSMFQRGYHERQEAALLRWSITLSLFAMPAFSMISMYAMALRIQQYGWSVDRVWASIMIGMMAIYALGYAYAALRGLSKQHAWLSAIAPTNTLAALLILLIIALSNSPILSPVRIAADSQVSRLLSAKIHADDFDFNYLRFDLGSVGTTQLERLKNITQHPESLRIQQLAKEALAKKKRWGKTDVSVKLENIHQHFQVFPKEAHLDQNLRQFLYEKRNSWTYKTCFKREQTCLILYIDLNQDTQHEAIIFLQGAQLLLSQQNETWHVIGTLTKKKHLTISQMKAMLEEETISTVFSPWKNLQVGQQLWGVKLH